MAKFLLHISLDQLTKLIILTLLNKFDCFICIEGNTGTGKSTLALHIARRVRAEFRRLFRLKPETIEYYYSKVIEKQMITIEEFCEELLKLKEKKAYDFKMENDLIYDQRNMIRALASWNRIFLPDEMINITFNRDFHSEDQKKIIKLINMYRDHKNLIIASVPQFQNLDIQIKNLTKIRISIAKRGGAVLQTPNKIIYGKDKWDSANNEKIEREWLIHGNKPKYTKLTTARGLIAFPPLNKKIEEEYQNVKNQKRSNIVEQDMGIKKEDDKDPIDKIVDMLLEGKIRNSHAIEGLAMANNMATRNLVDKIKTRLAKQGKPPVLTMHFWDKKKLKGEDSDALSSLMG